METAPLKSFASWARTALIREVTGRIAVVLAPASPHRVEQPKAVAALEEAITAAGGGDKGRGAVADRVAYTWFNRIIALRFMDANGYTGIGVVSPQFGVAAGQPEILAEAKRANVDTDIVSQKVRESVSALINGTRRSDDPQGEAYALLLVEYCRHWNRAMPFMFERQGDFTELLMPASLLADDSVMNRAVAVLTSDVCRDVEVIGWLYQFYISERKDEVFAGFQKNKKAGADEIPAATQLFTPHWIVCYLVENSLGRLWVLNRPSSRLVEHMDYYIGSGGGETDYLKVESPEELRVIDPACGSGHMLTYAFDLLYAIYEEEGYPPSDIPGLILTKNLYGLEIDTRAGALAAFALTMKARARHRTLFNKKVEPNVCVLKPICFAPSELESLTSRSANPADEETFWNQFQHADSFGSLICPRGSLIEPLRLHLDSLEPDEHDLISDDLYDRAHRVLLQAQFLSSGYHAVIANPPYMGSKNMGKRLGEWTKREWPNSKSDLFATFIERCLLLAQRGGFVGMVTMQSWMFLSSFKTLRQSILEQYRLTNMAHLGTNAFDTIGGEVVSTTAFIFENRASVSLPGTYLRLVDYPSEAAKESALTLAASDSMHPDRFTVSVKEFLKVPGTPISYWLSDAFRSVFSANPSLADIATTRLGMTTANNSLFTRLWFEISRCRFAPNCGNGDQLRAGIERWVPYNKGGRSRKWYGNMDTVIDWADDGYSIKHYGEESGSIRSTVPNTGYYFRKCVTWSKVSGTLAMRFRPEGSIFDVAGACAFADSDEDLTKVLAVANSKFAKQALAALSPSVNIEGGQVDDLPIPFNFPEVLLEQNSISRLVEIAKRDWDQYETSRDFVRPALLSDCQLSTSYSHLRNELQSMVDETLMIENEVNVALIEAFGLTGEVDSVVSKDEITLNANPVYRYGVGKSDDAVEVALRRDTISDFISYAVGCMFGRYSLNEPGLVLADQGGTLQDYLARVPTPTFLPDADNVIPIVDGDWFEDDIVTRFRQFLRVAFGEEHFEENLRFVTESLGVKDLRDYFVKSFYKDHVQRYKKRPIYWLFSSPKGSFNALIYLHRYTPATVSTVLNEYLREFKAKLEATLGQQDRLAAGGGTPRQQAAAQKEADRIRKMLLELNEYEHDVLYPLASQQIEIDLDDGVKVNYPKLGAALKKIPGLEAGE